MPPLAMPPLEQEVVPSNKFWWRMPISQWPHHIRRTAAQYASLLPPCWQEPEHQHVWMFCAQCDAAFQKLDGPGNTGLGHIAFLPSMWVCRCGLSDMQWRHQEPPHVDTFCRDCCDLMVADGIDLDEWCKRVRDELG